MQQVLVNRGVLILVLILISCLFLWLLKPFLVTILLATLFAALFHPLHRFLTERLGGRQILSASITMLLVICFVFIPLSLVLGLVVSQALDLAARMAPWMQSFLADPQGVQAWLQGLPMYEQLAPFREQVMGSVGQVISAISRTILDLAQSATLGTVNAILMGLIVLYTMFFLLLDGDRLLYYVLYYLPLQDEDEKQLLHRFTSVTRATLKGTAVIGFIQGSLAGAALAVGGVPNALFWAVAMMFFSVVPGVGTALIWAPAVLWIGFSGNLVTAVGVGLFCALVVGSIDNLLRPKLVGSDTQLHELLIFFSTLGGLLVFGFWGFVIGPLIAALFVTIWEMYGLEFREWLPTTAFTPHSGPVMLPHERRAAAAGEAAGTATTTASTKAEAAAATPHSEIRGGATGPADGSTASAPTAGTGKRDDSQGEHGAAGSRQAE